MQIGLKCKEKGPPSSLISEIQCDILFHLLAWQRIRCVVTTVLAKIQGHGPFSSLLMGRWWYDFYEEKCSNILLKVSALIPFVMGWFLSLLPNLHVEVLTPSTWMWPCLEIRTLQTELAEIIPEGEGLIQHVLYPYKKGKFGPTHRENATWTSRQRWGEASTSQRNTKKCQQTTHGRDLEGSQILPQGSQKEPTPPWPDLRPPAPRTLK